jgi:hypothetical protein
MRTGYGLMVRRIETSVQHLQIKSLPYVTFPVQMGYVIIVMVAAAAVGRKRETNMILNQ